MALGPASGRRGKAAAAFERRLMPSRGPTVLGVYAGPSHSFTKAAQLSISVRAGFGVEGDAHAGATVRHRSRVARDPSQPNLRQVHLIQSELYEELRARGFSVQAGDLGENIATTGIDLLALSAGTLLRIGASAQVEVTGLRNPCVQLDRFQAGLTQAVLERDSEGAFVRKAGIMGVVRASGWIFPGDAIAALEPATHVALTPV